MTTALSVYRSNLRSMGNFPTNDTRITNAVIDREINRALKRIALLHDWPWLQTQATITTVAGTRTYNTPTGFLRLISLRYNGENRELNLRSIQEVDLMQADGSPQVYAVHGGQIHLAATPDGVYDLRVRYIKQETVLVADADVPLIPDYWNDGVYEAALVELHRQVKQLDESGLAENRFQTWLKESQDNIPQTRGSVRVRVRPGSLI